MEKNSRKALHRGLSALISNINGSSSSDAEQSSASGNSSPIDLSPRELPLASILKNPFQPRLSFDKEDLDNLKESIQIHGIIEPIIVRQSKGGYEIIAGERRFRAAKELGLETVPVLIREKVSDRELKILALVENLQRADLNDIEIAMGYHELINSHQYTHEQLAKDVGKSRSFISNTLRLLKLPEHIKDAVFNRQLSAGHARALLALEKEADMEKLFQRIIKQGLNVRQTEELVGPSSKKKAEVKPLSEQSFDCIELENKLTHFFGSKVSIQSNKGKKGRIIFSFSDIEDLNRIVSLMRLT